MSDELSPPPPAGPPGQPEGEQETDLGEDNPEIRPGDKPNELLVFDHGFVRLDSAMADDLSVVNSARVSFAVRKDEMDDKDKGLIRFLMRDRHGTPFEHNSLRFHIRTPIFVAREWFRHRVGSFNEESARYHKLSDDFYVPSPDAVRSQVGKPGSYSFEPVDTDIALETITTFERIYKELFTEYERLIEMGVAKELARSLLPFGIYTQFYWTLNARSLMNFLSLRNASPAQYEIRTYAQAVEKLWAQTMPITHECFVEFGRRAP
jgi:thymidylate synthase (FAD)